METNLITDIAIVGGGPSGLMLAIELGCRGVRCVVLEEDAAPPAFPKANATSARTMEHYRRRGFAERVRACGLPDDRPQDVVYCTRGTGHEIARFRIPSPAAARSGQFGDYGEGDWPTPELPHRGQQMFIEPILLDEARRWPSVQMRLGARVERVVDAGERVLLEVSQDGQPLRIEARYVVGCDGARSVVREAMNVLYAGRGKEERDFFGGQMLTIFFRSPQLASVLRPAPAWTYWIVNPVQRGVLIAIDGRDTYVAGIQLKPGQAKESVDVAATLAALVGQAIPYELIETGTWLAGYMLVAERFRAGRCFIAGDAAHLFTPVTGMGYNTSIDDAVNLGWKLAAVVQGWASDALLDTYETERRPVAVRNTSFAKHMADSMGSLASPPDIEDSGAAGQQSRTTLGEKCLTHIRREFNIPGLQLGVRYESAAVAREDGAPPPDEPNRYVPSGYPGARAPHVPVGAPTERASLHDRFGREFTLLCLQSDAAGDATAAAWREAAVALQLPLQVLSHPDAATRRLYGADLVLVRPDHHIAWRGDARQAPGDVLRRAIVADN
jgi:2-polyprenyl-6-methoxyphenol hydroxylase-like FAD-dependent oxidoreductase